MSRGDSATRTLEQRSAAARKGWLARKRRAAAAPAPGSQQDRVVAAPAIGALIARIRANLDARKDKP